MINRIMIKSLFTSQQAGNYIDHSLNILFMIFICNLSFFPFLNKKSGFWCYPSFSGFHIFSKNGCSPVLPQKHFFKYFFKKFFFNFTIQKLKEILTCNLRHWKEKSKSFPNVFFNIFYLYCAIVQNLINNQRTNSSSKIIKGLMTVKRGEKSNFWNHIQLFQTYGFGETDQNRLIFRVNSCIYYLGEKVFYNVAI